MSIYEMLGIVGLVLVALIAIGTLFGFIDWRSK